MLDGSHTLCEPTQFPRSLSTSGPFFLLADDLS